MNTRKKILFVITKSNWGGAQRYVYDLTTSLPSQEYEVAVACGGTGLLIDTLHQKNITVFEIKSFQRDISFTKEFSSFFELQKLYKTWQPDIVHLNSSKAGGLGALAARCAHVPKIIFTAHGWPFWEPRNIFQKSLIAFFSWLTVVFSHVTICISKNDTCTAQRMPLCAHKIHYIPNGIEPYETLTRSLAREKLFDQHTINEHGHDIWMLTNAELTANKNHIRAIDAVLSYNQSASQKIFYVLMGDGESRNTLSTYITTNTAENQITLLGFVEHGATYYNAFDIFFLPSLKEGVPYVLLEAGNIGMSCIASNVGGIPEIITHEKSGILVSPENCDEMKKAFENLSKNGDLRVAFGTALKKTITELYTKKRMLEETERLYK